MSSLPTDSLTPLRNYLREITINAKPLPEMEVPGPEELFTTEEDRVCADRLHCLVDPAYVAGAGIFSLGGWDQPTELGVTRYFRDRLTEAGAHVYVVNIDDLLDFYPHISVVTKVLLLGEAIGCRDAEGRPQFLLISGFTMSGFFSEQSTRDWMQNYPYRGDRISSENTTLRQRTEHLSVPERARCAYSVLSHAYNSSWQILATGKNSPNLETIPVITIAPRNLIQSLLQFMSGTTNPRGAECDPLYRWRTFLCNYVNDGV